MIDTHCHILSEYYDNIDEEIEKINIINNYLCSRVNFINKQFKNDDIEEFLKRQNDFFTNISLSILLGGGVDKQLRLIKKLKSRICK